MANGNSTGLFGDDNRNRVRFFRDPERGPMTQADAAIQRLALADRKNAGGRGNSAVTNNHSAIMQSGFWMEDAQDELDREIGIERDSGFFINADRSIALD